MQIADIKNKHMAESIQELAAEISRMENSAPDSVAYIVARTMAYKATRTICVILSRTEQPRMK